MKKRKGYIWIDVLEIKLLLDAVVTLVMSNISASTRVYDSILTFITFSILSDVLMAFVVFFGTIGRIRRVFKDERYEVKYRFWSLGLKFVVVGVLGVFKAALFDVVQFGLARLSYGPDTPSGHGIPAYTITYGFLYFVIELVAVIAGVVIQLVYNKRGQE